MVRSLALLAAFALSACGRGSPAPAAPGETAADESSEPPLRYIAADERVPPFRIETSDGQRLDSRDLVGKRGMVLVFFATWCHVCEVKMPMIRGVLHGRGGDLAILGVSLDEEETWGHVPAYLTRHRFEHPVVQGTRFLNFASSYNPQGGIPWVLVIDPNGFIIDAQMGIAPDHLERLVLAVEIASRREPPGESAALAPSGAL